MTQEEFKALQETMPWTTRKIVAPGSVFFQVIDKNGNEVSMISFLAVLETVTAKLAKEKVE